MLWYHTTVSLDITVSLGESNAEGTGDFPIQLHTNLQYCQNKSSIKIAKNRVINPYNTKVLMNSNVPCAI